MTKQKIVKIAVCAICAAAVLGYGVHAFFSWNAYRQEKAIMAAGKTSESLDLFHDQGDIYMQPLAPTEKEDVTIRMRCGRYSVTKAQIQVTLDEGTTWQCYEMKYENPDDTGYYDLWIGEIPAQSKPYFYRFAVSNESNKITYLGVEGEKSYQMDKEEMFYVIPGFNTPEWSQGTMWYYVHTGQFFNGDTSNDLLREYLAKDSTYGNDSSAMYRGSGDFAGIQEKLDYIQSLGVSSLALGPYFSSSETVGFGTDNMAAVETAFGTEEELKALIQNVHDRDMKITTDMIISYATNYSKYFNAMRLFPEDGAYQSKDSLYYDLFRFPQWPYNAVKIWGSMGLNVADEEAAKLIYQNKDSMALRYMSEEYGLDGYRFDAEESVGNLGYEYEPEEYFEDIISSIKNVSEDKLVLAENCTGISDQYNTLFDSSWQKNGYFAIANWFSGTATGSGMLKILQDNLINTARPRALSSYNFLGQHDVVRLWEDTEAQKNDIRAALLLQMTYLGSPVVYFGDEIGVSNGAYHDQYYSGFNWDESEWNYDILNLVKALGSARKEYSCLRSGALCQGEVEDGELFFAFGRFDESGSAITLCNKQGKTLEKEINVSRYHVKDGQTLTDYLTGATYKVKDGKVTVDVVPGGTLLVTDSKSSENRGKYTIADIGKDIEVIQKDWDAFEVTGKGTLKGKKDSIGLLSANAYNNESFEAGITTEKNAQAALMFRSSEEKNSAFYAVVVQNGKLTVQARKADGGKVSKITTATIPENAKVRIVREDGNCFETFYQKTEEEEWICVEKSQSYVEIPEAMLAGMTALKGTVVFSQVVLEETESQICDEFDQEGFGSMFGMLAEGMKIKNGKLVVESTKDKLVYADTNAHSSDFTFKTKVGKVTLDKKAETSAAGVMSMSDEEDAVMLVRTLANGEPVIAFGKLIGGKWQMNGYVKDTEPEKEVTLQLQRIGSFYTAVASYDSETWFMVGQSIYSNYTGMYAGVCALNAKAEFAYACFGNSIEDKVSTNTPMTLGDINTSFADVLQNVEGDKMAYVGNEDSWKDVGAGYDQTSEEGISLLCCENKLFKNVKVETTITFKGGSGTAGILIGKQTNQSDLKDCYQIALNKAHEVIVSLNGKEMSSHKLDSKESSTRLVVRRENGYLHVFAGEDAKLVLSVYDTTYEKGYVSYYTDCAKAAFINYDITALDSVWNPTKTIMGTSNAMEMVEGDSLVSLESVGLTEGIVTFQADTMMEDEKAENQIGAIIGGSFGRKSLYGGVSLLYNYKTGVLEAKEGEISLGSVKLAEPAALESLSLMVVFRNGKYDIYTNQSAEPVLSVETEKPNGGTVSLYSSGGTTFFYNTSVRDITGIVDIEGLDIVKTWRSVAPQKRYTMEVSKTDGKAFQEDFLSYSGWNENFYKIKSEGADWYIEDGKLKAESLIRGWNIATITSGLYKNVEVSMMIRFTDYTKDLGSSISISTGKQNLYAGRDTGLVFTIYGNGFVNLEKEGEHINDWNTYVDGVDDWFEMKMRVSGNTVTISFNGTVLFSGSLESVQNGYVALQSEYANLEIDEFTIKPLS